LRFPDLGRDALLALACATLSVAVLYALLALRETFSNPSTPGTIGIALFALIHGGAASVNVPPIPSFFGLQRISVWLTHTHDSYIRFR
jgi:hypothetical protein